MTTKVSWHDPIKPAFSRYQWAVRYRGTGVDFAMFVALNDATEFFDKVLGIDLDEPDLSFDIVPIDHTIGETG